MLCEHEQKTAERASPAAEFPWYAIRVRTRSEPLASAALRSRGYYPYVPTFTQRKVYSDRLKNVNAPAFPGYVFCQFDTRNKVSILSSPAVQHIVSIAGQPTPIDDQTIEGVKRALLAGAEPTPYLAVGQAIQITSGVLAGLRGILLRAGTQDRVVVSVHLLQRAVAVTIGRDCFEPV